MPDELIRRTNLTTTQPIGQSSAGWFCETIVENHTGEVVCVLRPTGEVQEIPPLFEGMTCGRRLIVKHAYRAGFILPDVGYYTGQLSRNVQKYPYVEIEVDYRRLTSGPVFIQDVGLSFSLKTHITALKYDNHMDPGYTDRKIQDMCAHFLEHGYPSPVLVNANSHDRSIDFLYMEVNEKLCSIKVRHDLDQKECLSFITKRRDGGQIIPILELDWSKLECLTIPLFGSNWRIGTSIDLVEKAIREAKEKRNQLKSREEVETMISDAKSELSKKLSEALTTVEQLKRELELTKKDLANANAELERANAVSRASYEQQTLANKLAIQQQEACNIRAKNDMLRESSRINMESDRIKAEADVAVAHHKVAKEEASLRGAEISNTGTLAKTAAVIVPVAASAALWVATHTTSSIAGCALAGGSVVAAPVVAAGVALGLAAKPVVSIVKHAGNCISSAVGKVRDFFSSWW